ncbi:MAG: hypothetical protein PHO74_02270, partial [Weeksellaceae bacterium]|nr:hypothetical protein [Weeksellaceae bacterium]
GRKDGMNRICRRATDSTVGSRTRTQGLELGELKGKNFIPSQALANFHFKLHHFPEIEIGKDKALAFLRGSDPEVDVKKAGIYLLTFKGFGLGWIKFIGSRSNNYYPKPWRIKNF